MRSLQDRQGQGYDYDRRGSAHYRKFYGRLVKAMSWSQALETLGFPSGATPSEDEVRKRQRDKLIAINYKGLGGAADPKEATEINVAAEILRGRMDADRDAGPSHSPHNYSTPRDYTPPQPPPPDLKVTFDEAKAKAGVPAGVEWLFVTEMQKGEGDYSGDESTSRKRGWVAVGQTGSNYVFVGVENQAYKAYYIGGGRGEDIYKIRVYEHPKPANVTPSWLVGNIVKALQGMDITVHFNHKVRDARGKQFTETMPATGTPSLSTKHMMVELGMVSDDDPSVANRKHVVEMKVDLDHRFGGEERKPGYFPVPPPSHMYWDGGYHGDYYKISLVLNGKDHDLSETDWNTFCRLKLGGKKLIDAIFGDRYYSGTKKNITRMPKAKAALILEAFVERFKDLPAPAMAVLVKAAEQIKGGKATP
jgi:hypothetical protein